MCDVEFKIEKAIPFKLNNIIKLKSSIITKNILKKDISDKSFKETLLVDEILEVEEK